MKKTVTLLMGGLLAASAMAATPVGTWRSIDDKTKEAKAQIVISERGGALYGKVEKILSKGADPAKVCSECTDDRKGKPIVGMEIIRGAKKDADDNEWVGGKILDPENGKVYNSKLMPSDDGKTMKVRGYIGPFYRTQQWVRVN